MASEYPDEGVVTETWELDEVILSMVKLALPVLQTLRVAVAVLPWQLFSDSGPGRLKPGPLTTHGLEGIPFATTTRLLRPEISGSFGVSKLVDTGVVPVATPMVL